MSSNQIQSKSNSQTFRLRKTLILTKFILSLHLFDKPLTNLTTAIRHRHELSVLFKYRFSSSENRTAAYQPIGFKLETSSLKSFPLNDI